MPGSININISIATYERLSKIKKTSWSVLLNELLDVYQDAALREFQEKLDTPVVPAADNKDNGG